MAVIEYEGKRINVDDEGYLTDFDAWDEVIANALAREEGLEKLTKEQMDIIKFIREYYRQYNFFPILNAVCKNVHQPKNCINEKFINPIKTWRIAGFPKPDELIINLLEYGQTPT